MSQTGTGSYGFELIKAQAGQLGDIGPYRIDTFAAEGTVAIGAPVKRGTNADTQVEVINADSDTFLGVAVFTHTKSQGFNPAATPSSTGAEYRNGDSVNVLREGRVWVMVDNGGCQAGNLAYATDDGEFTEDPVGAVGPVGRFEGSSANGEELVLVDIVREISAPAEEGEE